MKLLKKLGLKYKVPTAARLTVSAGKHSGRCGAWTDDGDSCYSEYR